ncbi:hypothetical protein GF323_02055 [Candidatus Woesearchaeota archaeon]|nr:hypothetical protein [Candidatus Woesearchaeota archaeon]
MVSVEAKVMFVFPGQGAQYVGMGKDLHEANKTVQRLHEKVNSALGYDLMKGLLRALQRSLTRLNLHNLRLLWIKLRVC